ncbi:MAG: amidase, partial [Cyclobacteriaceae bacterium]|nr:amidase [Cyclobacteriaceae bacterium]
NRNATFDNATLEKLKEMGVKLEEVSLPDNMPVEPLIVILLAEAAASFDEITRNNRDSLLVRQDINAWPNSFRSARFIPAVEYINANRIRYQLVQELYKALKDYDVIVTPSFGGTQLLTTNLTGYPCAVVPNGFNEAGRPVSISFISNLYDEGSALELAHAYQKATDFEDKHPEMFKK